MRGSRAVVHGPWSIVDGPWSIVSSPWSTVAGLVLIASTIVAAQYTTEEVAAGLRAPDPATRLRAVQILRDGGHPEAAGPLSAALSDPDDRVKLEAIDAERALFVTKPIAHRKKVGFIVEVRTSDAGGEAAGKLALLPRRVPAEVLAGLAEAMRSPNPRVRFEALVVFGALAPLGGRAAEDAIRSGVSWTLEALKRGSSSEQIAAAGVVGRALEGCGGTLAGSAAPAESLCTEAGNGLLEAVNSREPQVRRAAMAALGQLRYPNAAQALADQLSFHQRGPDAVAALGGLAGIGHETSVDIFKPTLASPDAEMRRLAVEGLARAGSRGDLPDLERLGRSERSKEVLLALHYAWLTFGVQAKPDQLIGSLKDPALRPLALRYLLDVSPSMAPALAESLRNPDRDTRMLVADVLGFSRNPTVIPALDAATKDADADVARAALRAISRIKLGQ
jgi:HEAT repeat protein